MSTPRPYIPPEILDQIVDPLHADPKTSKECRLVSKSWIPRTRKHLFGHVSLRWEHLCLWKKTFPDPATSPGYYTHTLTVNGVESDSEESNWVRGFPGVEMVVVEWRWTTYMSSPRLAPFHRLAPSLRSLCATSRFSFPHVQLFDLVCSPPLLEDLTIMGGGPPVNAC